MILMLCCSRSLLMEEILEDKSLEMMKYLKSCTYLCVAKAVTAYECLRMPACDNSIRY